MNLNNRVLRRCSQPGSAMRSRPDKQGLPAIQTAWDVRPQAFSIHASFARLIVPAWLTLCLLLAFGGTPPQSFAQTGPSSRSVQGKVFDSADKARPNAIVYLQNQKTQVVKTYISTADGGYRFAMLGSDADYQLWAEYQGHKSKTRSISSFDSKKQFTFELKIDSK